MEVVKCDVLIIGSGGAGLFAAIHAYDKNPDLQIIIATKGLIGKCGCSRMVQGGLNVVLDPKDSHELHFKDTLNGGQFLNNQEMAWTLVTDAPKRVYELELKIGCFWDRASNGRIHQKPFAGQSFDRTIHRRDLTGIEIIARMTDQIFARDIAVLEETRGIDLLLNRSGDRVVGAVLLNVRTGRLLVVNAKAVVMATGGGASMYKIAAPSLEKTGDGMAMCFRAGAEFVDMEMLQFHPTGLLAGESRLSGSVLEEGLRGVGGRLYNAIGERFMERYDPEKLERSTRDVVARSGFMEIMAGRGTPNGGVYLDMSHLGATFVEQQFPGMCERVGDIGRDLAREKIEISPTAHYQMGGVRIDTDCFAGLAGLLVCGEDAGGTHGANRLGGNGIGESVVYGARAGDSVAAWVPEQELQPYAPSQVGEIAARAWRPFRAQGSRNIYSVREEFKNLMWEKVGVVRNERDLRSAIQRLEDLYLEAENAPVHCDIREYNMEWNEILNVQNWLTVARMVAASGLLRTESRGSHYRSDFPQKDNNNWLVNIYLNKRGEKDIVLETRPVLFTRLHPQEVGFK